MSEVVSIDLNKSPAPLPDAATIAETIKNFQVSSESDYAAADHMIRVSMSNISKVEAFFEGTPEEPGIKVLAHRAHAAICEKIRTITAPWRAVRPTLEPRMKAYRRKQEEIRRAEELRLQREAELREHQAREEAARIQREADAEAARLRQEGNMRAAKERQREATAKAEEVTFAAAQISEVGAVLRDSRPANGPGESRPWIGEVTDIKAICKAIGDGTIELEYLTPVRGAGDQMVPLVEINQSVLNNIAKRMGREQIGIPGARGTRGLQLRFGRSASPVPVQSGVAEEGW
jgi:hypothetical protein